ncbi:hypothetical protein DCC85_21825 [Paenibacillus sp. CAA11]|uniref:PucR family transcriptional regulator n=1 Tax=Paenibacillus sp. CAA11 TaxID=1532905 RepID=UPI000D34D30B|nr:helix-turn-helix domain-containing protein [Paenibacillus sp. CAA11]AWB46546.1 hypothetical protein DCC85_21825 [Paenibacillus sp. CAA11]
MKVDIHMIADRLGYAFSLQEGFGSRVVMEARPYSATSGIQEDMLYITEAENTATGLLDRVWFVAGGLDRAPQEVIERGNYILSTYGVRELSEEINRIIRDLSRWGDRLLEMSLEDAGLPAMIQHANEKVPNPMIVFDSSYKLLAVSGHLDVSNDPAWERSLESGYVSLSEEQYISMKPKILSTFHHPEEDIYSFPHFGNRFYHKDIFYKNRHLAHFNIIEQVSEISAGQVSLARFICKILSIELQKKEMSIFSTAKLYEYLFKEMIANPSMGRAEIQDRLHYIHPSWKPYLYVLTIYLKDASREYKQDVLRELSFILKESKNFEHNDYLVVLLERAQADPLPAEEQQALIAFLKAKQVIAGISEMFPQIEQFSDAYGQSVRTIQLHWAEGKSGLFAYEDTRLRDLLYQIASIERVERFYYPPVIQLMREGDQTLLDTLRAYVDHPNNQKVTAQILGIHRTTLIYRIHKLQERMNVDLGDPDTLLHIKLTLMMMAVKERWQDPV